MYKILVRTAVVGAAFLPLAAYAQTAGTVTSDLNMRAGPGTNYQVVGTIPNGAEVSVEGCVEAATWCLLNWNGRTGYSDSSYILVTQSSGETIVVREQPSLVETVVGKPIEAVGDAAAGVVGAVTGAVVGVADAAVDAITPEPKVRVYVDEHPVEPVYFSNEVVVGTVVPDTVTLVEVPDYEYQYANLNGETVLVEPGSRQVVYVYR